MAKIFKGDVNFGFVINQTGAQPLDSRSVVQNYTEMLKAETFGTAIYNGMIVATIDEGKLYMLIDKTKATTADAWKEIGEASASDLNSIKAVVGDEDNGLVKDVNDLKTTVAEIPSTYATKTELETAISNVDVSALATKEDVSSGLAAKVDLSVYNAKIQQVDASITKKADASTVYTKDVADSTFVKSAGYVAFSDDEKSKLAGIAAGAEVNYVKSVGADLAVDDKGKLTVSIPVVKVPFQSVAKDDKVLTLDNGVLSSTLSYVRDEVNGVDSLVLKGIDDSVIGSVPVADFIADGMLESVKPKEDNPNIFEFTFNSAAGDKSFEVDFSKYVDTYHADGTTIELGTGNTFNVKAGVFEAAGAAEVVKAELDEYKTSNEKALTDGLATKLDTSAKVNGVSFDNGEATLGASNIALDASITRTIEDGKNENVYDVKTPIHDVLQNLSQRIDVLDPSVSGELGITSIIEGAGVNVEISSGQAEISVKASAAEGNIAEVKTDGIYVAAPEVPDMRPYWEVI